MKRRAFLGLTTGGMLGSGPVARGQGRRADRSAAIPYSWIEDIRSGTSYRLLRAVPRVDLIHLGPADPHGGEFPLDLIDWDRYPQTHVIRVPVIRPDPEWHVLGPARFSVSLWLGPHSSRDEPPSALLEFESTTPVSVYLHRERIQQIIVLAGLIP